MEDKESIDRCTSSLSGRPSASGTRLRHVALVEQLPLTLSALALTSLVVCAGTALQVTTGVGVGLLAGPILILILQSETAIFVAITLNLLVSLALLPQEKGDISWPRREAVVGGGKAAQLRTLVGGGFSGFMSGSLAIPGPVAMWALLQQNIAPSLVRATLRATFVFSYSVAFLVHFGLGGKTATGRSTVAALVPALADGVAFGVVVKRSVGEATLHAALRLLLLVMGLSLLWKGISDVTA